MKLRPYIIAHVGWSTRTFGSGPRPIGLIKHIRKELIEIRKKPDDLKEWVDIMILGLDGAWRSGHTVDQIVAALKNKQVENMKRQWPAAHPDKACEHVRTKPGKSRRK